MNNTETFAFSCIKRHETDNAILVFDPISDEEIWLPYSQIEETHFNEEGEGTVVMTAWLAKKKHLI